MSLRKLKLWKFQFLFNEIRELSSNMNVVFYYEVRLANCKADVLVKHGVESPSPWVGVIM